MKTSFGLGGLSRFAASTSGALFPACGALGCAVGESLSAAPAPVAAAGPTQRMAPEPGAGVGVACGGGLDGAGVAVVVGGGGLGVGVLGAGARGAAVELVPPVLGAGVELAELGGAGLFGGWPHASTAS